MLPSFAAKWLVPRLGRFRAAHPDLDLRISASSELVDFARDDVDVGIRMGSGVYPGLRVERLFGEALVPVCSPLLREGPHPLAAARGPRATTCCCTTTTTPAGSCGCGSPACPASLARRGPVFTDSGMVVQAAAEGQGVALARRVLAAGDLAAGRLVQPFDVSIPHDLAYYLVCPEATAEQPKIAAFRSWLLAESQGEARAGDGAG